MKVAMPVWMGRISPVFDVARQLLVVKVEDGTEVSRCKVPLGAEALQRRAQDVAGLGVEVVICGGISRTLENLLGAYRVTVIPWVTGAADEVLTAYLAGEIPHPRFMMPGCPACRKQRG